MPTGDALSEHNDPGQLNKKARALRDDNPERALDLACRASSLAEELGDREQLAHAWFSKAVCYRQLGRLDEGVRALYEAQEQYQGLQKSESLGYVYHELSSFAQLHEDVGQARQFEEQALRIAEKGGYNELRALALKGLGMIVFKRGDGKGAIEYFFQALAVLRGSGQEAQRASVMHSLARAYEHIGLLQKALDTLQEAEKIYAREGPQYCLAAILNGLGSVNARMGHHSLGLEFHLQSLKIFRAIGHIEGQLTLLYCIGMLAASEGQMERALGFLEESVALSSRSGSKRVLALALSEMAEIQCRREDFAAAESLLSECLRVCDQVEDVSVIGQIKRVLAVYHYSCSDAATAMEYFREALRYNESVSDTQGVITLHVEYALRIGSRGGRSRAIRELEKALRLAEKGEYHAERIDIHQRLHRLFLAGGNSDRAAFHLQAAFECQNAVVALERGAQLEQAALVQEIELLEQRYLSPAANGWQSNEERLRALLQSRYPGLTATEEKICVMIYFNMQSKEMASALNSSHHTINWHRYNIRKKVGLDKGASIRALLARLFTGDSPAPSTK